MPFLLYILQSEHFPNEQLVKVTVFYRFPHQILNIGPDVLWSHNITMTLLRLVALASLFTVCRAATG